MSTRTHLDSRWLLGLTILGAVSLAPPSFAGHSVEYRLTFEGNWTAADHSGSLPRGAHFTALVGATHAPGAALWTPGELATPGIEAVAETGSRGLVGGEIEAAMEDGVAGERIDLTSPPRLDEESIVFGIDENFRGHSGFDDRTEPRLVRRRPCPPASRRVGLGE